MSDGDIRREMRQAFEEMTEMPSNEFASRLRSAVRHADRGAGPRLHWAVVAAAAGIVVAVVGSLVLMRGGLPLGQVPAGGRTPTPTGSASPAPATSPSPATYPAYNYQCVDSKVTLQATVPQPDLVITGFLAAHSQAPSLPFEEAVVQYTGVPVTYSVRLLASPVFQMQSGKGGEVTLEGTNGLELTLTGANVRSSGQAAVRPGFAVIREVRELGAFEGYYSIGIGLSRPVCYAIVMGQNPNTIEVWIKP